jgi:hypothetical protein
VKDYIELPEPRIAWLIPTGAAFPYFVGHYDSCSLSAIRETTGGTGSIACENAVLSQAYERADPALL